MHNYNSRYTIICYCVTRSIALTPKNRVQKWKTPCLLQVSVWLYIHNNIVKMYSVVRETYLYAYFNENNKRANLVYV